MLGGLKPYTAAVRQGEQERAVRKAAEEQRRRIKTGLRESEGRSRLQVEKERQRRLWSSSACRERKATLMPR